MRETIDNSARYLYGLIHARYIITTRGLAKMVCHIFLFLLQTPLTPSPCSSTNTATPTLEPVLESTAILNPSFPSASPMRRIKKPSSSIVHAAKISTHQKEADMAISTAPILERPFLICYSWSTHIWYRAKDHQHLDREELADLWDTWEVLRDCQATWVMDQRGSDPSVQRQQRSRRKCMTRSCLVSE